MTTSAPPPNYSDLLDGPALIALWGEADSNAQFRLGTQEYAEHHHRRGQLFCVESGLVHVRTRHGSWLLPPHRAGWIPPDEPHSVSISGAMRGWSVLVTPAACADLPSEPCVVGVSELLRALVRRASGWTEQLTLAPAQSRAVAVLLDELQQAQQEPLHLPMPRERRLRRIAEAILTQPGDARTLAQWASWGGLSARNLSRLMLAETGHSFAQWRQQARLLLALERLAQGEAVNNVADALGYATPSNFIAMFRRSFGLPPARYFSLRPDRLV
ncbi:helix-turn-helix domain-containing protein [Chitinimonas sp.]|uniref:AraC family transcriptional regulator n=1 Tax=Chitinimonas sp. TaxID=1934313 RepID=UPI0035B36E15